MILKIGDKNVIVTPESNKMTKLSITDNMGTQIVYMDKAETAALVAGLKANAPIR